MSHIPRKPKEGDQIELSGYFGIHEIKLVQITAEYGDEVGVEMREVVHWFTFGDYGITWRFADETPAPIAERKPRELTDEECNQVVDGCSHACSYIPPEDMYKIIANFEAMRSGLLEGGE